MWCKQLKELDYIIDYFYQPETLQITPKAELCLNINKKNKCYFLLHPLTYTYDFKIIWNIKAKDVFYNNIDNEYYKNNCYFKTKEDISYIDVKGEYTRKNRVTDISYPILQKILYHYSNFYVQKIVPIKLFKDTFAPTEYLLNNNIYKVGTKKGTNKSNLLNLDEYTRSK
ncbi:MAG TPA: hypothetical protein PKD00_00190 [Burkholderiales bacterium]|nr:hypothetical protein [Burkholderiales bacterium]